jgi:hypothetical protein
MYISIVSAISCCRRDELVIVLHMLTHVMACRCVLCALYYCVQVVPMAMRSQAVSLLIMICVLSKLLHVILAPLSL